MAKTEKTTDAVYDASSLGVPKQLVLGVQHLFAMFGSTVLVPILTGLSVSATLLFAGVATLIMHWITGKKVPVFLGSSFAFLAGYFAVVANGADLGLTQREALCLRRCGLRWSTVPGAGADLQGVRQQERDAFLPPCGHRPHHHCHRPDFGSLRHQ